METQSSPWDASDRSSFIVVHCSFPNGYVVLIHGWRCFPPHQAMPFHRSSRNSRIFTVFVGYVVHCFSRYRLYFFTALTKAVGNVYFHFTALTKAVGNVFYCSCSRICSCGRIKRDASTDVLVLFIAFLRDFNHQKHLLIHRTP